MSKKNRIKKEISFFLLLLLFLVLGLSGIYKGLFSTRIEIDPTGQETIVHIYKKPVIPIFKESDIVVPKVYQAIMTRETGRSRSIFHFFSYRVELKAPNGQIVPITSYSLLGYFSNKKLTNQINDSIQNKIPFTIKFIDISPYLLGLFVLEIIAIFLFVEYNTRKETKKRYEERKRRRMLKKNPEGIQQTPDPKPEKYNNINDSIIKK
ncbi:MAG: hypothetical protein J6T23_03535 [Elusimicrobia bacterium]|nr:hypothetical protein [Elusimicrobiota bacterium]